jgi:hypothetical protein
MSLRLAEVNVTARGMPCHARRERAHRVLERPDYREAARGMQASLATEDGTGHAPDEIAAAAVT